MRPEAPPVGTTARPDAEAVRFRSAVGYGFPASEVAAVEPPKSTGEPSTVVVNFMGLAGALGPLPTPFTERLVEETRRGNRAFGAFLDIFNHRLVSLMVRAKRQHLPTLGLDPPWATSFGSYLCAAIGMGTRGLCNRLAIHDGALLRYAGLLSDGRRSAHALQVILADHFGVPVRIRQFVGCWRVLADDQITVLGRFGRNQRLGGTAVLGRRVWDQHGRIEIELGPLTLRQLRDFLPIGRAHDRLRALVEFFTRRELDVDVRLCVAAREVPTLRLSGTDGPRLGWTSWLRATPATADDRQVRLAWRT